MPDWYYDLSYDPAIAAIMGGFAGALFTAVALMAVETYKHWLWHKRNR